VPLEDDFDKLVRASSLSKVQADQPTDSATTAEASNPTEANVGNHSAVSEDEVRSNQREWRAQRQDNTKSLLQDQSGSIALACILTLGFVLLCTSVANVMLERAGRWLYPQQLDGASDDNTDEFQSQMMKPQDRDFRMIRAMVENSKFHECSSVVKASVMYIVYARAQELTRGFGDPPAWAEVNMVILTIADISFMLVQSLQVWLQGSDEMFLTRDTLLLLLANSHWTYTAFSVTVHFLQITNVIQLIVWAFIMDESHCRLPERVSLDSLWHGHKPPSLSVELWCPLILAVHFFLFNKYQSLLLSRNISRMRGLEKGGEEETETRHEVLQSMSRSRLLVKATSQAPKLIVISLAVREVLPHSKTDEDLRTVCLYLGMGLTICYTLAVLFFLSLTGEWQIDSDLLHGGVLTVTSDTDHIAYSGNKSSDVAFRWVRRISNFAIGIVTAVLAQSVFWMSGDYQGPAPTVPTSIMWILFILMQSILMHQLFLFYEIFGGPIEDQMPRLRFIRSSLREIDHFGGLLPMLALVFLCTHMQAVHMTLNGEPPDWVLTAMNVTAQATLLQVIVSALETTIHGFLFDDSQESAAWQALGDAQSKTNSRSNSRLSREYSSDGAVGYVPEQQRMEDPTSGSSGYLSKDREEADNRRGAAIAASLNSLDTEQVRGQPSLGIEQSNVLPSDTTAQPRELRRASTSGDGELVDASVEVHFLAQRSLNLFVTIAQTCLLQTVFDGTFVVMLATWTMDAQMSRRAPREQDWRVSIFPLVPATTATSMAMEATCWLVLIFMVVKSVSGFVKRIRYLYGAVSWSIMTAFQHDSQIVDLVMLMCLVMTMVHSRAVSFHGVRSSPPMFAQLHMIFICIAMLVILISTLAAPAFTSNTVFEDKAATIVPGVRRLFQNVELCANIMLFYSLGVLIFSLVMMRPEDALLANGTTGVSWKQKGDPPEVPPLTWNMLVVCVITFATVIMYRVVRSMLIRMRHRYGKKTTEEWFEKFRSKHGFLFRWHHGFLKTSRQMVVGGNLLGTMYLLLSRVTAPPPGSTEPLLVKQNKVSQETLNTLQMFFFIASIITIVKCFFILVWFTLREPSLDFAFMDEVAGTEIQPTLDRPKPQLMGKTFTNFFEDHEDEEGATAGPTAIFKRMSLILAACEAIIFAVIAFMLFPIVHEHTKIFSTGAMMNGSLHLFVLYLVITSTWSFLVLLGVKSDVKGNLRKFDGYMEVVSPCPLLLLLFMTSRSRAVEVAGRHAVVPEWMQHLNFACSMIIVSEFIFILFFMPKNLLGHPGTEASQQAGRQEGGELPTIAEIEDEAVETERTHDFHRNWRVAYLGLRMGFRLLLYLCVSVVIYGLFWMTPEQCLPRD
jgi:hypothetical protein